MTTWGAALIGVLGVALTTLLTFLLTRNRNASQLAGAAMESMNQNLTFQIHSARIIEKLRAALYLQSQRLDAWEDWGLDASQVMRVWRRYLLEKEHMPDLPEMPKPPEGHLDVSSVFTDEDIKAIKGAAQDAKDLKKRFDDMSANGKDLK